MTEKKTWRFWVTEIRKLLAPGLTAVIAAALSWALAKEIYQPERLPILGNPSFQVQGTWKIDYSSVTAYEMNNGTVPLTTVALADSTLFDAAQIYVESDTTFFKAVAMDQQRRTWKIEGYVDDDAVLYVYKDVDNPNSFGSAVVRMGDDPNELVGLWTGVSPGFLPESSDLSMRPFLVGGWVRWRRQ